MDFEVVIIGGASAGLSAAMALGRSNRQTLVIDSGNPRNKPAPHAHNIFTRDGTPPLELLKIAKSQLKIYPSVSFKNAFVTKAQKKNGAFQLTTDKEEVITARKLIIGTGVTDTLPDIKGFKELWGTKIVHCPYCHGWEQKDQSIGILLNGKNAEHLAPMVYNLNKEIHLFTNGKSKLSAPFTKWAQQKGINITETPVIELVNTKKGVTIKMKNGDEYHLYSIYSRGDAYKFHNELPVQLGCKLTDEGSVIVDDFFNTSVPGVFAVGDLSHPGAHQVIFAASGGAKAGMACNGALTMEDYEHAE